MAGPVLGILLVTSPGLMLSSCGPASPDSPDSPERASAPSPGPGGEGVGDPLSAVPEPAVPEPPDLELLDQAIRDQYAQARSEHEAALDGAADDEERAAAYAELGSWYHAYRFYSGARASYLAAVGLDPESPRWTYLLATVDRLEGRWREAAEGYEKVLVEGRRGGSAESGPYVPALIWRASIELEHHRLAPASELYQEALQIEPRNGVALHGLAKVALEEGRIDDAIALLEDALAVQPEAAVLLYAQARALLAAGYQDRARALLDRVPADNRRQEALRLTDPWLWEVETRAAGVFDHLRSGRLARQQGRPGEALKHFQRALQADQHNLQASLPLADLWIELRRPRDAIEVLEEALRRYPNEPRAIFQRARAELLLGELDEAEASLEHSLEADPRAVDPRLLLAEVWLRQGRGEEALQSLAALRRQRPGNPRVARGHALCLEAMGRREAAISALAEDLDRMPEAPTLKALATRLQGARE